MKELSQLLGNKRLEELAKNPRFKLIDLCYRRINTERKGTKYKVYSKKLIAIKTSHLSLEDFDFLVKKCQHTFSFGKCFFGSLKVKKPIESIKA